MTSGPSRGTRVRPPAVLLVPALGGAVFLALPLTGLLVRAPWSRLPARLTAPEVLEALRLSLVTATTATVTCLLLGVPLAWLLARSGLPGRRLIRALVTVPVVLPPVVSGVALLLVLGRNGWVGTWLYRATGLSLPFTTTAVVLAQVFVALPFLVLSVEGALLATDGRHEEAAATLGAGRWIVFRRVTLPMAAPGIAAGTALCWARALGEFGATVTFAGSFPGRTRTMPLAVYLALEEDPDAAVALSLLLLVVSVAVLVGLRGHWWGSRR